MSIPPSMPPLRPWQHVLNGCVIAWRFVAVVAAFALFGSVGILFLLVLWPLRNPPPHKAMQRQLLARRIVAASWRTLLGWLLALRQIGALIRKELVALFKEPANRIILFVPALLQALPPVPPRSPHLHSPRRAADSSVRQPCPLRHQAAKAA